MPCSSPIYIKNRRYYKQPEDYSASQLLLHPEDIARQVLLVPCGQCEECLRAQRNDWYIRLNRELAACRRFHRNAIFLTITINPNYEKFALDSPSAFIRKFFERIRHHYGRSIKHAVFQEFSPEKNRLHFHAVLFGRIPEYRSLHRLVRDLGFIWISEATSRTLRYCVKYIVKQVVYENGSRADLDPKFRRKFISAGVGDYLGTFPPPSYKTRSWSLRDARTGLVYHYRIPRYYERYSSEEVLRARAAMSGLCSSILSGLDFEASVCMEVLQEFCKRRVVDRDYIRQENIDTQCQFMRKKTLYVSPRYYDLCKHTSLTPDYLFSKTIN